MAPPNQVPAMYMLYIEGPKMNWTVDDGLYHRFLKWQLKCKTILDCELANLPTKQKCQKIIAWSGDFQYGLVCIMEHTKRCTYVRRDMEQV